MNSCVHLCVCLCVRPINISTLPSSRCLYNTAVLLLLMSLPVFTWLLYWSTFWHPLQGKAGEGAVYSQNAAQDISLHFFLHWCSSNLGTNLCVVVAKIDELPDWESASVHSWGNNKSPGLLSRRAPWRVACVCASSPLPCLPHLSSKFSSTIALPFLSMDPFHFPTHLHLSSFLSAVKKGKLCPAVRVQGDGHRRNPVHSVERFPFGNKNAWK